MPVCACYHHGLILADSYASHVLFGQQLWYPGMWEAWLVMGAVADIRIPSSCNLSLQIHYLPFQSTV